MTSDPEIGRLEPQEPLAVQLVASVDDQVSVAEVPIMMVSGLTEIVTVGAAAKADGMKNGERQANKATPRRPIRVFTFDSLDWI